MISVQFWYVHGDVCNLGSICFDVDIFSRKNNFSGKYFLGKISYCLFGYKCVKMIRKIPSFSYGIIIQFEDCLTMLSNENHLESSIIYCVLASFLGFLLSVVVITRRKEMD